MARKSVQTISELYQFLQKNMATKDDIGALSIRMDDMERNYVTNESFAEFKNDVLTNFDGVFTILNELKTENTFHEGGLKRVEETVENNKKDIKVNKAAIKDIKLRLKIA